MVFGVVRVAAESAKCAERDKIVGDEEEAHHDIADIEVLASDEDKRGGDEEEFCDGVVVESDPFKTPHAQTSEKGDGGENGSGYVIGSRYGEHHLIGLVEHFRDELHVLSQCGTHARQTHNKVGEGAEAVGDKAQYEYNVQSTEARFFFGGVQG